MNVKIILDVKNQINICAEVVKEFSDQKRILIRNGMYLLISPNNSNVATQPLTPFNPVGGEEVNLYLPKGWLVYEPSEKLKKLYNDTINFWKQKNSKIVTPDPKIIMP